MDSTQLLKGVLDVAVLAAIQHADGYGYDVVRRLRAAGLDEIGDASVYGTLRRLYSAGALTSYVVPSDGGPHRKYYGINPQGRAMLDEHADHAGMAMAHPPVDYAPLDRVAARVTPMGLAAPVLIAPPASPGQPWTAKSDAADRPLRIDLTLDPDGTVLSRRDFATRPFLDRLVGTGVAAHEGQLFGLANQLINLFVAVGLATLAVSGALMWWRRRPADALGAPPLRARSPIAIGFFTLLAVLGVALPMLGGSLILVLLVERVLLRHLPGPRRWLGLA